MATINFAGVDGQTQDTYLIAGALGSQAISENQIVLTVRDGEYLEIETPWTYHDSSQWGEGVSAEAGEAYAIEGLDGPFSFEGLRLQERGGAETVRIIGYFDGEFVSSVDLNIGSSGRTITADELPDIFQRVDIVLISRTDGQAIELIIDDIVIEPAIAPPPEIVSIEGPAADVYHTGDELLFTVNFSEAIEILGGGLPTLIVNVQGVELTAQMYLADEDWIQFLLKIPGGMQDNNGIVVERLDTPGFQIVGAGDRQADLSIEAGDFDGAGLIIESMGPPALEAKVTDGVYGADDDIEITVQFSETVYVEYSGTAPYISLMVGSDKVRAAYVSGDGTDTLTFRYKVQPGQMDADGVFISDTIVKPTGASIKAADGDDASVFDLDFGDINVTVDTAGVSVVDIVSDQGPTTNAETLTFTVTFSEAVTDVDNGDFSVFGNAGATVSDVRSLGDGAYAVTVSDIASDGEVRLDIVEGAEIRDAEGEVVTLAAYDAADPVVIDRTPPTVAEIKVPSAGVYGPDDVLEFTVRFSDDVRFEGDGEPVLTLRIGDQDVTATFQGQEGDSLQFSYTVVAGQSDPDGIEVVSFSEGTTLIVDTAGNVADLALDGVVGSMTGVVVAQGPVVVDVYEPETGVYSEGGQIEFSVKFDQEVTVDAGGGAPYLKFTLGDETRFAGLVGGGGSDTLLFRYYVASGDEDADGIAVSSEISTPEGTSITGEGGLAANLGDLDFGDTSGVKVDAAAPTLVSMVADFGPATNVDPATFTVTFSEEVENLDAADFLVNGLTEATVSDVESLGDGAYRVTVGDFTADGAFWLSLRSDSTFNDAAGNAYGGDYGESEEVLFDTTGPAAPLIFGLDYGSDSGIQGDGITSDATPTLATLMPGGETLRIYDKGTFVGTAASLGPVFSFTPETPLEDGEHVFTARWVDDLGNEGAASAPVVVTVDTVAPTVSITADDTTLGVGQTATLKFSFSEAPAEFTDEDITTSGGTLSEFAATSDPKVFTAKFTPDSAGATAQVVVDGAHDLAGNVAEGELALTINVVPPVDPEPPVVTPPVTPPQQTETVDGVQVGSSTTTNSDGSTTTTVTIPVVTPSRPEEVGNNTVADIPLVKDGGGEPVLSAQLPTGYGLQASGGDVKPAGNSLTDLIREIQAHTPAGSTDQTQLTGGGSGFLDGLDPSTPLVVQTIVPTVAPGTTTAPDQPLVISGSTEPGAPQTALLIDARNLPAGTTIELQNVDFAAVIGHVVLRGGDGAQVVLGDGDDQNILLGADDDTLNGGAGQDTVGSAAGNDDIRGGDGQDVVFGGEGDDFVHGNLGHDTVNGNDGFDRVYGGQGDDLVYGDAGSDWVFGDLGDDFLHGNLGSDTVEGGLGQDTVHGGQGDDAISGGDGNDALNGDQGNDLVHGGLGADTIAGYDGDDSLRGGQGDDIIRADAGNDWLSGDGGSDTLFGGAGADVFHAFGGSGTDLVMDFNYAEGDRVRLLAGSTYTLSQVGADTVVDMTGGAKMVLAGVSLATLGDGWILAG